MGSARAKHCGVVTGWLYKNTSENKGLRKICDWFRFDSGQHHWPLSGQIFFFPRGKEARNHDD